MMIDTPNATGQSYDPNKLFDVLLATFGLDDDAALGEWMNVGEPLIRRIRCGELPVDALLLIRMNELSGISVRELRRLMGDRRSDCRPGDMGPPAANDAAMPVRRHGKERNDAGLPNSVQWS